MWEYLLTLLITIWLLQLKGWPHLGIWGHLTVLYASKDAALGELIGSCVLSYEAKVQTVWVAPAPPPSGRNREHYYLLSCVIKIHYSASWHIISDLLQYKRSIFSLNLGEKKKKPRLRETKFSRIRGFPNPLCCLSQLVFSWLPVFGTHRQLGQADSLFFYGRQIFRLL